MGLHDINSKESRIGVNIPQNSKFIHDKLTNQPHPKWRKPEVKQILSTLKETSIEVEQILAACSNLALGLAWID